MSDSAKKIFDNNNIKMWTNTGTKAYTAPEGYH